MFNEVELVGTGMEFTRFALFRLPKLSTLSLLIFNSVKVFRFSVAETDSFFVDTKVGIDPVLNPK